MKKINLGFLLTGLLIFISCSDDSEEDLTKDCSNSSLQISIEGTVDADCTTDGSLEVSASGGSGDVDFSVDGGINQTSGIFSVSAGTYSVTATDKAGCTSTLNVTVDAMENSVTISTVTSTGSGCGTSEGTIEITATGGTALMYRIDDGNFQESNMFTSIGVGSYEITVQDDEGCSATRTEQVLSGISLEDDVMPLLALMCVIPGCHNGDNGSGRNWTMKSNVIGNAAGIKSRTQSGDMPRTGSITQDQIDLLACWVDDGGLDN